MYICTCTVHIHEMVIRRVWVPFLTTVQLIFILSQNKYLNQVEIIFDSRAADFFSPLVFVFIHF